MDKRYFKNPLPFRWPAAAETPHSCWLTLGLPSHQTCHPVDQPFSLDDERTF
jgi:hypothetical protein